MALAAGSIVSPKTNGLAVPVNGPTFGIIESGSSPGGPFIVLWQTGSRVADVAAATIDEILAADGSVSATYVGRRIKPTSPSGQTAWAYVVCIKAYKRNGSDTLLCQSAQGEYFVEVLAAQAEVVS